MLPIVSAEDRIAHYEATLDGERIPANIAAKKQLMIERFSDWVNDIVPREIATHEIVQTANEPLYLFPWYQAFFRQAYKDRFHGGAGMIEITKLSWVQRGLDSDILQLIIDGPVMTDP